MRIFKDQPRAVSLAPPGEGKSSLDGHFAIVGHALRARLQHEQPIRDVEDIETAVQSFNGNTSVKQIDIDRTHNIESDAPIRGITDACRVSWTSDEIVIAWMFGGKKVKRVKNITI